MRCKIFDTIDTLNEYLKNKSEKDIIDIKFQSQVTSQEKTLEGRTVYTLVDRFFVMEK